MAKSVGYHLQQYGSKPEASNQQIAHRISGFVREAEGEGLGMVSIGRYYVTRYPDEPESKALVADIGEMRSWETRQVELMVVSVGPEAGMHLSVTCPNECGWTRTDILRFSSSDSWGIKSSIDFARAWSQADYLKTQHLLRNLHEHRERCEVKPKPAVEVDSSADWYDHEAEHRFGSWDFVAEGDSASNGVMALNERMKTVSNDEATRLWLNFVQSAHVETVDLVEWGPSPFVDEETQRPDLDSFAFVREDADGNLWGRDWYVEATIREVGRELAVGATLYSDGSGTVQAAPVGGHAEMVYMVDHPTLSAIVFDHYGIADRLDGEALGEWESRFRP